MKTLIVYDLDSKMPVAVGEQVSAEAARDSDGPTPDVYEIRPREERDGFDLIGDRLRYGPIWYAGPDAVRYAVAYAKYCSHSRSHRAIIRVFYESGNVSKPTSATASSKSGERYFSQWDQS